MIFVQAAMMITLAWMLSLIIWVPWIYAWPYIEGNDTVGVGPYICMTHWFYAWPYIEGKDRVRVGPYICITHWIYAWPYKEGIETVGVWSLYLYDPLDLCLALHRR